LLRRLRLLAMTERSLLAMTKEEASSQ